MDEKKKREVKLSMSEKVLRAVFRGEDMKTLSEHIFWDEIMPWIGEGLEACAGRIIASIFYDDDYYDSKDRKDRRDSRRRGLDYTRSIKKKRRDGGRRRGRDRDEDSMPSDLGPNETHYLPFESRKEAKDALHKIISHLKRGKRYSAYEFYRDNGVATTNFKCQDWGWTDPDSVAKATRVREEHGSWRLYLPKTELLEDENEDDDDDDDYEEDDD